MTAPSRRENAPAWVSNTDGPLDVDVDPQSGGSCRGQGR